MTPSGHRYGPVAISEARPCFGTGAGVILKMGLFWAAKHSNFTQVVKQTNNRLLLSVCVVCLYYTSPQHFKKIGF